VGLAAAAAGPVIAVVSYLARPDALVVWNEDAALIARILAGCCALAATIAVFTQRSRT
jgi:hypothetical protein